jgi:hypothetical protein
VVSVRIAASVKFGRCGLAIDQYPDVLTADQSVGGEFGAGGLDEQVVEVGHLGQAGVGKLFSQFVDLPVAV